MYTGSTSDTHEVLLGAPIKNETETKWTEQQKKRHKEKPTKGQIINPNHKSTCNPSGKVGLSVTSTTNVLRVGMTEYESGKNETMVYKWIEKNHTWSPSLNVTKKNNEQLCCQSSLR